MIDLQCAGPVARLRGRVRDIAARRVRYWIGGHQIYYQDDPRQRVELAYPTWAPMRVMEAVENDGYPIQVGKYCGVHYTALFIHGGQHHIDWVGTLHGHIENGQWVREESGVYSKGPIVVGNDVWVGVEAVISSGVTIGDGAVVAARAMVTKSVEPYEIVGGNPARHIRYRFEAPIREALLRIKWWDWPVEKVAAHKHQINSPDVAGFVERHDPQLGPPSCPLCA